MAETISDLSADLDRQLKHKVKSIIAFSVAINESMNITEVAQLAIFHRCADEILTTNNIFHLSRCSAGQSRGGLEPVLSVWGLQMALHQ